MITETLNVSGNMLIKLFTKEQEKSREFERVNDEVTLLQIRETVVGRWFFMTLQTFVAVGPMLIYLFGGLILIRYHDLTIGGIVMFVTLVGRLYGPVNTFSNIHVDIVRSMALFERIFQYFDLKSEIIERPDAKRMDQFSGDIRFDHVYFSYNEKHTTLVMWISRSSPASWQPLSAPAARGKPPSPTWCRGPTDTTGGAVLIDGVNVKEMTLNSLRSQIGMVTQDSSPLTRPSATISFSPARTQRKRS